MNPDIVSTASEADLFITREPKQHTVREWPGSSYTIKVIFPKPKPGK